MYDISARGTQELNWHVSAQQTIGPCVGTVSGGGTETLRFRTPEPVGYKLVGGAGYEVLFPTKEPSILAPLAQEVKTVQNRDAQFSVTYTGSPCEEPNHVASTTDCKRDIDGSAATLDLRYSDVQGGGIEVNFSDINNPYTTGGKTFNCPTLNDDHGPLWDLQAGGTVNGLDGLVTRVTAQELKDMTRGEELSRSRELKLKPNELCAQSPDCTSGGSIEWTLRILRVK